MSWVEFNDPPSNPGTSKHHTWPSLLSLHCVFLYVLRSSLSGLTGSTHILSHTTHTTRAHLTAASLIYKMLSRVLYLASTGILTPYFPHKVSNTGYIMRKNRVVVFYRWCCTDTPAHERMAFVWGGWDCLLALYVSDKRPTLRIQVHTKPKQRTQKYLWSIAGEVRLMLE